MFCTHSFANRIKRLIALIGLLLYVFLGVTSPETASAFLLQIEGPHEVSIMSDFSGQAAVVFHHHHLGAGQNDTIFHRNHHQVEPDHVYLFPKRVEQSGSLAAGGLKLELHSLFIQFGEFVSFSISPELGKIGTPKLLAQPPPGLSPVTELRRFTVLLI